VSAVSHKITHTGGVDTPRTRPLGVEAIAESGYSNNHDAEQHKVGRQHPEQIRPRYQQDRAEQ
jgi:hypothetical protein